MDVAALSVVLNQGKLAQQVGIAVMKKAMDSAKTNNDALLKTMEQSISPHLGRSVDVKI